MLRYRVVEPRRDTDDKVWAMFLFEDDADEWCRLMNGLEHYTRFELRSI